MRILITGSKGLIGSSLKHSLGLLNIEVLGIDIRASEIDPEYGDILDKPVISSLVNEVDGIVHLAAVSRVIDGEKNPELCWRTNVNGTKNILDAALSSCNNPWVIYASSREVYGQPRDFPVQESAPLLPVNIYGQSKLAAEKMVEKASEQGLITAIIRFSNVFGRVSDYSDRVVPAFCRAAAEGSNIRVDGSHNLFDFTYVDDVVQGILSLIHLLSQKGVSLPPIHLTSGRAVSLGEIAKIAQGFSLYPIEAIESPSRSFDVSRFWGDTTLAHNLLNWKACVGIEDGMHRLINQYSLLFNTQSSLVSK